MTLPARLRDLEHQRIETRALLERMAARLDALEAALSDLVALMHQAGQLERLWECPRCGFLVSQDGLCNDCIEHHADELTHGA